MPLSFQAIRYLPLLATLVVGVTCRPQPQPTPGPAAPRPTATATTPQPTRPSRETPAPPPPPAGAGPLTLWVPPSLSSEEGGQGGVAFAQLLSQYRRTHPEVEIRVLVKKPYGQGGLVDLLQATSPVVPDALPDLAVLDVVELVPLHRSEIVRPLNDVIGPDVSKDLLRVGREAATYEGQLLGLPLQLDAQHLLYHPSIEGQVPATWADLVAGPHSLLFPAGGDARAVGSVLLQHYASRGGRVTEEGERLILDRSKLVQTLEMFASGRASGVFPQSVIDLDDFTEGLEVYLTPASPPLAHTTSTAFLRQRESLAEVGYAPLPTTTGATFALVQGWAVALLARPPERQAQAVELMRWLIEPQQAAYWTRAARVLPGSQAALTRLAAEDAYYRFIARLLDQAAPFPAVSDHLLLAQALQQALQNVLLGQATPEQAASQALAILAGGGT